MNSLRGWVAIVCCVLLSGCASLGGAPPPAPAAPDRDRQLALWAEHRAALAGTEQFALEGRVAASGQAGAARLRWNQKADGHFDGLISGPVGIGSLRVRGSRDAVEVQTRGERFISQHPERDLQALLGWSLPLEALPYWARGLPQPGRPVRYLLDTRGHLQMLYQDGWQIDYQAYRDSAGARSLPARMVLSHDGRVLTLIADDWQITTPP